MIYSTRRHVRSLLRSTCSRSVGMYLCPESLGCKQLRLYGCIGACEDPICGFPCFRLRQACVVPFSKVPYVSVLWLLPTSFWNDCSHELACAFATLFGSLYSVCKAARTASIPLILQDQSKKGGKVHVATPKQQ